MFTPLFTPGVKTLYFLKELRGKERISLPGDNFTPPGDKIHPWGQSLSLGAKLKMGLWALPTYMIDFTWFPVTIEDELYSIVLRVVRNLNQLEQC
jgi:hypothetical protein